VFVETGKIETEWVAEALDVKHNLRYKKRTSTRLVFLPDTHELAIASAILDSAGAPDPPASAG
jgi:hypothetical protein